MSIAIEVNNISKHFYTPKRPRRQNESLNKQNEQQNTGESVIRAVDNVSFHVLKGEIFGLLGPNGAGKTTTIRMLTGVLKPTGGKITILERDFLKNKIEIQQKIGNVPEMANAYLDLTGFQNLELIGELYGVKKTERKKRAEYLLKKFEIFKNRNLKAKKYSKGMKQRLLLCMALISNPKVLFLDEPTSGLDVRSSIIIKNLIKEYNKIGMTIVLTTHNMDVANELCDRIGIINKGKLAGLDTTKNLLRLKQEYLALDVCFENEAINEKEIVLLRNIKQISKMGNSYRIIVSSLNDGLCDIVDYARSNNLRIDKIHTYEPHLQDVFLKIINEGGV